MTNQTDFKVCQELKLFLLCYSVLLLSLCIIRADIEDGFVISKNEDIDSYSSSLIFRPKTAKRIQGIAVLKVRCFSKETK